MTDVVIVAGARTAVGSFNGAFATVPAHDLGTAVIKAALARAKLEAGEVSEVVLGQVLTAGQGQNPGRQASLNAGIPKEVPAWLVNQICGSGLTRGGDRVPADQDRGRGHCDRGRAGIDEHVTTCRTPSRRDEIRPVELRGHDDLGRPHRRLQLVFIWASRRRTSRGNSRSPARTRTASPWPRRTRRKPPTRRGSSRTKSPLVTVKERKGERIVEVDEYIRDGATYESVAGLRPAFAKDGTVTAGNASGLNDGAAALVLMSAADAAKRGLTPLARIASFASAGVDPKIMGMGPVPASRLALKKAGWSADDLDLIEANEAFAAQACAVNKDMGWNTDRVNVNGGAIAIGHPIGASGGRILVTLLHEMARPRREERARHHVHRRRDGRRAVCRAIKQKT